MARILVIEDSPTQARQLALILEDAGFDVETAPDAEKGFDRLAAGQYDLVLSDLLLPGGSGFDLCRRVKMDPRYRHLPVVVHTSQADPVNVLRGLEAGADGFMTKDREPEEIVGRIRRALAPHTSASASSRPGRTRVVFLGGEFELSAKQDQLADVLLSAFEDVLYLDERRRASEGALRDLNTRLQSANRELEQRNGQLQDLADELAAAALSERQEHEARKRAESQLIQEQRLSSLGQMAAGVAHEINNPLAFVSNNMAVLQRDVQALRQLLRLYHEGESSLGERQPELLGRIRDLAERIDLTYTLDNLDGLMNRSRDGLKRIQQIVKDLRDFVRLDESDLHEVDLNAGIESTLNIVRSQAKKQEVELDAQLTPLPPVACYPAKINQVVLNLVVNALDACQPGGKVTVSTRPAGEGVEIEVADNGSGIDPAIRDKIFDPFFTTKALGQGTGLGLSISYGIVETHGGRIHFESEVGQGTRFTVELPCKALVADSAGVG